MYCSERRAIPTGRIGINIILALLISAFISIAAIAQEAPRVIKMVPENGADNVDPKLEEIVITFSESMQDGFSVTGGGEQFPKVKSTRYKNKNTVFIIKVGLEAGKTYRFGLNSQSFQNFMNKKGIPLVPVPVSFTTRGGRGGKSKSTQLPSLGKVDFELVDLNGLTIKSQDYKGVPLFISFGAAW